MASIQTIQATDQITDSRADINANFANLNSDKIETSYLDDDTTLSANSDTKIATQKAVKAYIDAGGSTEVPQQFVDTSAGVADAGKGVKLNASGVLDGSFMKTPTVQTFTSSGNYTKPAGMLYAIVEVQGSGGNGATASAGGGGGGGGAYSKKIIPSSSISTPETITIGTAGLGSGNTSFGSLLVAPNGGNASGATAGGGGTASGGDINISGTGGQSGEGLTSQGGEGGSSYLGKCGSGGFYNTSTSVASNGRTGQGYGAGGGGASPATDNNPTGSGGNGTAGIVIVTEYYN
jgi:hypothetical protein